MPLTVDIQIHPVQQTIPAPVSDPLTEYYLVSPDYASPKYYVPDNIARVGVAVLEKYGVYYNAHGFSRPRMFHPQWQSKLQGYPGAVRLFGETGKWFPLTDEIVWYLFDLCLLSQYGFVYKSSGWNKLTKDQQRKAANEFTSFMGSQRVLTNNAGLDGENRNVVAHAILGEPLKSGTARQSNLVMIGNVVKRMPNTPTRMIKVKDEFGNVETAGAIQIETWNGKSPVPNAAMVNPWNPVWKHICHFATNSTPFDYEGNIHIPARPPWRVNAFSFFNGRGSPYAVLAIEPQWIALPYVRQLRKSELFPKTYVP